MSHKKEFLTQRVTDSALEQFNFLLEIFPSAGICDSDGGREGENGGQQEDSQTRGITEVQNSSRNDKKCVYFQMFVF